MLADEPPALPASGMMRGGVRPRARRGAAASRTGPRRCWRRSRRGSAPRTGIANLKIRYNRVFGYSFEVSRSHLDRVPPEFVRQQTLTGAERFVTAELEELERRIAGAEAARRRARAGALRRSCWSAAPRAPERVAATARALAAADVLAAFAERARRHSYCRPRLVAGTRLRLAGARHPVIEELSATRSCPTTSSSMASRRQIVLLTGPNMGGKSTYLRQVALAVIMAWSRLVRRRRGGRDRRRSTASSPGSAPPTTSPAASRPSWSR